MPTVLRNLSIFYTDVFLFSPTKLVGENTIIICEDTHYIMETFVLQIKNVTKKFAGTTALDNVSFELAPGEVHGLIGENGAGKSTLMNVIMGIHKADCGQTILNGQVIYNNSPNDALLNGIGMVPQELNLMQDLSIAENIFIGNYQTSGALFDRKKTHEKASEMLASLGVSLDIEQKVSEVSAAFQQLVSIARTLTFNSKIIIFDEPTASLTLAESERLFGIIDQLKRNGHSIIYISHHLEEISRITDTVTIMRDGQVVHRAPTSTLTKKDMIFHMANQEVETQSKVARKINTPTHLEVKNFSRGKVFKNISFKIKKSEILGFAGLVGSGRTELFNSILGIDPKNEGQLFIDDNEVELRNCHDAIMHGIALVPEERRRLGIFPELSVAENLIEPSYSDYKKHGLIDFAKTDEVVNKYVGELKVKVASIEDKIKNLSGGNQQKVVLGRWMAKGVKLLVLDEPTRGIDVRAKGEIYKLITAMANEGMTIVVISSEIEELMLVADRILVMHQGEIKGEITDPTTSTREDILKIAMQ